MLKGNRGNQIPNTHEQVTSKMRQLIKRELRVIRYISEGYTGKQIALKLQVTEQTVRHHAHNLMKKLNARNRAHAVAIYDRTPRNRISNHLVRYLTSQNPQHITTNLN